MLQRHAEATLMELTHGLMDAKPIQRSAQKKRIMKSAAKRAGFIEAGSGLMMSVANENLGTKDGQFWEVKGDVDGQPYLERMSYDTDLNDGDKGEAFEKKQASAAPESFSTSAELYEWFEDHGGRVSGIGENLYRAVDDTGNVTQYEDRDGAMMRVGGDQEEDMQRRADSGEEPPMKTLPESVELDVSNKYKEQGKTRELSLSEQSDENLVDESLERKGLTGLEFD